MSLGDIDLSTKDRRIKEMFTYLHLNLNVSFYLQTMTFCTVHNKMVFPLVVSK